MEVFFNEFYNISLNLQKSHTFSQCPYIRGRWLSDAHVNLPYFAQCSLCIQSAMYIDTYVSFFTTRH